MTSGLRWTDADLEAFRKRQAKPAPAAGVEKKPATPVHTCAPPAPKESPLERRFDQQLVTRGAPSYLREYYFAKDRDWRFDFAWPERKVAVEIQGGAHRIKGRFKADLPKRAAALLAGWRVLELGRDEIRSEQGIAWLLELLSRVDR